MRRKIRSYIALLPTKYRIGMLALVPILAVFLNVYLEQYFGMLSVIVFSWIYVFLDMLLDYWVFGGICTKDGAKIDYIKSSCYGYTFLKNGIIFDIIRRFLGIAVLSIGTMGYYAISRNQTITKADWIFIGIMIFWPYTVNTLGLNLTRYFESLQMHIAVTSFLTSSSLGAASSFAVDVTMGSINVGRWTVVLLVLTVLAVLVTTLTIWHMLYKIKKSYADGK